MIICLPNEILYYLFLNFSEFFDTVNLKILNKNFKELLDDKFYKEFGINLYGEKFWTVATMRDSNISKPCKTIFEELRRIETFQSFQLKKTGKRYKNQEFYSLWIAMEPKMKHVVNQLFI